MVALEHDSFELVDPVAGRAGRARPPRVATGPATIQSVIDLAIEIAREGREGRKIGTLFTVGAEHDVFAHSRCLILDPLAGHSAEQRRIEDPNGHETLKELAQLDGGFIISGDGIALSACRYFESRLHPKTQPLGLGTRHLAAASISMTTPAIAVTVCRAPRTGATTSCRTSCCEHVMTPQRDVGAVSSDVPRVERRRGVPRSRPAGHLSTCWQVEVSALEPPRKSRG